MEYLTTQQLCEMFRVNPRTIRRWELLGTLPPAKRMPSKRWVRAEVERAMGSLQRANVRKQPRPVREAF